MVEVQDLQLDDVVLLASETEALVCDAVREVSGCISGLMPKSGGTFSGEISAPGVKVEKPEPGAFVSVSASDERMADGFAVTCETDCSRTVYAKDGISVNGEAEDQYLFDESENGIARHKDIPSYDCFATADELECLASEIGCVRDETCSLSSCLTELESTVNASLRNKADKSHKHEIQDITGLAGTALDLSSCSESTTVRLKEKEAAPLAVFNEDGSKTMCVFSGRVSTSVDGQEESYEFFGSGDNSVVRNKSIKDLSESVCAVEKDLATVKEDIVDTVETFGTALEGKQDKLTAGANITIGPDGTISSTGNVTVDTELCEASGNPIANSAVTKRFKDVVTVECVEEQVSTAVDAALSGSGVEAHIQNRSNPHNVTAEQVGTYTKSQQDEKFLPKGGGTMTGNLILSGDAKVTDAEGTEKYQTPLKAGDNITITDGVICATGGGGGGSYVLPVASATTLGGVKVSNDLNGALGVEADGTLKFAFCEVVPRTASDAKGGPVIRVKNDGKEVYGGLGYRYDFCDYGSATLIAGSTTDCADVGCEGVPLSTPSYAGIRLQAYTASNALNGERFTATIFIKPNQLDTYGETKLPFINVMRSYGCYLGSDTLITDRWMNMKYTPKVQGKLIAGDNISLEECGSSAFGDPGCYVISASIPKASATQLGGVKVGAGLSVAGDGTLSVTGGTGGSSGIVVGDGTCEYSGITKLVFAPDSGLLAECCTDDPETAYVRLRSPGGSSGGIVVGVDGNNYCGITTINLCGGSGFSIDRCENCTSMVTIIMEHPCGACDCACSEEFLEKEHLDTNSCSHKVSWDFDSCANFLTVSAANDPASGFLVAEGMKSSNIGRAVRVGTVESCCSVTSDTLYGVAFLCGGTSSTETNAAVGVFRGVLSFFYEGQIFQAEVCNGALNFTQVQQ